MADFSDRDYDLVKRFITDSPLVHTPFEQLTTPKSYSECKLGFPVEICCKKSKCMEEE